MKKKKLKVLIIGYGSIGQKHAKILSNLENLDICIFTKQNNIPFKKIKKNNEIISYNPDYIVLASITILHFKYLKFLEKNLKKKIILVEKPLFEKIRLLKLKNNYYYVGYNLRFHPIIKFLKKKIYNPFYVHVNCSSYLPTWRKNINYQKSNSALKNKGGGVLLELSHEIDYINWIFGEMKILSSFNKKISNLKINTDDILILNAKIKRKKTIINLNINFFSKIQKREIQIETAKESIQADLINNNIKIFKGKKMKKMSWKNYNIDNTYIEEHKNLIKRNFKNFCTVNEAIKTLKIINQIKI